MKNKIKKWFEKNKDKIFVWICVGLIAIIVLLFVLFQRSDVEKMKDNNKADISVVNDVNNLCYDGFVIDDDNVITSSGFSSYNTPSEYYYFASFYDVSSYVFLSINFIFIDISSLVSNYNLTSDFINVFGNCYFEEASNAVFDFDDIYFPYYHYYTNSNVANINDLINNNRDSFNFSWDSSVLYPSFDYGLSIDLNSQYSYYCIAYVQQERFIDNDDHNYIFLIHPGDSAFYCSFSNNPTHEQFSDLQDSYDDLQDSYDDLLSDYRDLEVVSNTNYQNGFNDGLNSAILNERNNNLLLNSVLIAKGYQNNTLLHTSNQFDSIYNDVYKLTFLTSNIGYEPLNDSDYLTSIDFEFSQPITINSSYFMYVTDLPSPNYHLTLYLDNNVVVDLNYNNDSLPLPITFNNEYTFNKIKLYNTYSQENQVWNIAFGSSQAPYNYYLGSGSQVSGYASGYQNGFNDGLKEGHDVGYQEGLDNSYSIGYQAGYNVGIQQDVTNSGFRNLFNSILSYPINFISSVFNFEFMGINVASVVLFLVSIGVVLFVIKRLWK